MMTISRPRPVDILIRNSEGDPIAIVEVRNRQNLSRDAAIEMRHNIVAGGLPTNVPYFLLLSQEVGFLWKGQQQDNLDAPPAYEFPMDKVVTRYSNRGPEERLYNTE